MFQEVGLSEKAQRLVDNLEWSYSDKLTDKNDIESLVPIYCDMRISPKGIVSLKERILELHSRVPVKNLNLRLSSASRLEKVIQQNTALDLSSLDNEEINRNVANLMTLELA